MERFEVYLGCCSGFSSRENTPLLKPVLGPYVTYHWKKVHQFCWSMISLELGEKLELGLEILFSNYNLDLL